MEFISDLIKGLNYLITFGGGLAAVLAMHSWLRKPSDENREKSIQNQQNIYDLKAEVELDHKNITELKYMQAAVIKALVVLLDHELYGNHTENMEQAKRELIDVIIKERDGM